MKINPFDALRKHEKKVALIQEFIIENPEKMSLKRKGISNNLRGGQYKKGFKPLDISHFNEIVLINQEEETLLTEPCITFSRLCDELIPLDLCPPVVPEFKGITVGGAIMGGSLESSSHLYGQVSDCTLEYECLLGSGKIIKASPNMHADLFYGLSCSYGTIALLTLVKMKLIRVKKYVRLTSHLFSDLKKGIDFLQNQDTADFKEGICFGWDKSAILHARFHEKERPLFTIKPYSPSFAKRLEPSATSATMALKDYLFRYDHGAFWMGDYVSSFKAIFQILFKKKENISKNILIRKSPGAFFRFLFGWAYQTKFLYKLWHRIPHSVSENLFFIHDFYAPSHAAPSILNFFLEKTAIFPVWLCPVAKTDTPQFLSSHFGGNSFLNLGLYGIPQTGKKISELSQELEKEILLLGGRKMLYSMTRYDFACFSKYYDIKRYDSLRKKYHADQTFPHLYTKITGNIS